MKTSARSNHTKHVCIFAFLFLASICVVNESSARVAMVAERVYTGDSIKIDKYLIKIIPSDNGGYGYDIYVKKKLVIHQPTIPAMQGNTGFATKTAAEKVARKVVGKMQKGESLPTITIEEMKQLNAIPR